MIPVRHPEQLNHIPAYLQQVQARIQQEIQQLQACYQEDYQASRHGWFVVLECLEDCFAVLPCLTFSLYDKINRQEIEHVCLNEEYFEVLITLNDTEAVLVFLHESIAEQAGLTRMLERIRLPG